MPSGDFFSDPETDKPRTPRGGVPTVASPLRAYAFTGMSRSTPRM